MVTSPARKDSAGIIMLCSARASSSSSSRNFSIELNSRSGTVFLALRRELRRNRRFYREGDSAAEMSVTDGTSRRADKVAEFPGWIYKEALRGLPLFLGLAPRLRGEACGARALCRSLPAGILAGL